MDTQLLFNVTEEIKQIASTANEYSSLTLVIVTIIYVFYTQKIARETKKLREADTLPFVSIAVDFISSRSSSFLTIQNISRSPAYHISFDIEEKYCSYFKFNFHHTIPYLAPDQKIKFYGKSYNELKDSSFEKIPIK